MLGAPLLRSLRFSTLILTMKRSRFKTTLTCRWLTLLLWHLIKKLNSWLPLLAAPRISMPSTLQSKKKKLIFSRHRPSLRTSTLSAVFQRKIRRILRPKDSNTLCLAQWSRIWSQKSSRGVNYLSYLLSSQVTWLSSSLNTGVPDVLAAKLLPSSVSGTSVLSATTLTCAVFVRRSAPMVIPC